MNTLEQLLKTLVDEVRGLRAELQGPLGRVSRTLRTQEFTLVAGDANLTQILAPADHPRRVILTARHVGAIGGAPNYILAVDASARATGTNKVNVQLFEQSTPDIAGGQTASTFGALTDLGWISKDTVLYAASAVASGGQPIALGVLVLH